ncbi:uncharacterized protein LOC112028459 [Quercus suber]|uniref:uncharacterized protein LOC112028459 n=1 Tax=Quercus suber TaxID=58331 RepID=UPI000CE1EE10|nr:RRP15-like protein [Quercus suber]POF05054.1 rrp15-like protein [Quercus suber]
MAEETHVAEPAKAQNKRRVGKKGGSKGKKRPRMLEGMPQNKPKKIDRKMKKLYRKRARDYNSDGDDNDEDEEEEEKRDVGSDGESEKEEEEEEEEGLDVNGDGGNSDEGEESGRIQPGITMFVEGSRAFKMAFRSIIKKTVPEDALGPVLSAHKKLIAEKLAEEEAERKVKGDAKKEKQLLAEKGHVKPANYLDSNEKFLIGVATKGVVKLFNAVNKAQHAQKGLDPLRYKDAKAIRKRRKEAFFSALGKTSKPAVDTAAKGHTSKGEVDGEGPAWAPLRDNYMLTNSKLKDWDKMPETTAADDFGRMSEDSSSDGD